MCQTYLVTGGQPYGHDRHFLSSTQLLVETAAAWFFTGQLPTPRRGLRESGNSLALLDMKFITKFSGGHNSGEIEEIVEFSPTSGEWTVLDNMIKARFYNFISFIYLSSFPCL